MNIVYNASAGTGKTYQVTGLYEKLVLEEKIDPRKILLMTFTENAAAELRMRVSHRFQKARRKAEEEGNFEIAEQAISALSRLSSAPIGTMHSYSTSLLREHALEIGLSPGFSIIQGEERKALLDHICRHELLQRLESDPHFKTFCAGMHMIGSGGFGSSITESIPKLFEAADSAGITLENVAAMLPDPEPPVSIGEFSPILENLRALAKKTPKITQAIQTLENGLEQCSNPTELIEYFNRNFSGHFSYGDAKPIYHHFKELKEAVVEREKYRRHFPAAQSYAQYAEAVYRRFKQAKHEQDAVDFSDQLHMAVRLLESGKAKPELQYIIVDEVQDTSRIQFKLIQALWTSENNLVICGDKKQGIYTWRGADPNVMPDLEKAILERENSREENLQISYRSKAPVLDCINTLFSSVYDPDDYSETDHLKPNPGFSTEGEKTCIEHLLFDGDDSLSKYEKTVAEMAAVSDRIQLLTNASDDWKPHYRFADGFQPSGEDNTYRFSDILILLRRTTHQPVLEQALRHAGIPYTLGGKGRGLFSRQEIKDISLFLTAITNPDDAWALVGFLRSPWIGLPDDVIAQMAHGADGFSISRLQSNYEEQAGIIGRYAALTGTHLASEIVRLFIEETGFDALQAGLPRGEQRLANLGKILDWLRETERSTQTTPAMVARRLAELISDPEPIPEAPLPDPEQNAVTIMTVHGSKGLTKRVVMIPDCSFSDKGDTGFTRIFQDSDHNPTLGIRITAADKSKAESPGFKKAGADAKAVRNHEDKNLFYVAMTRARDLVITSASVGKKAEGWMEHIEPMLGNQITVAPYSKLSAAAEKSVLPPAPLPTPECLKSTLSQLPSPPAPPVLQRLPATRFAKEQERTEHDHVYESGNFHSLENAAALGTLGHAVLEQLALNGWSGSISEWLERLSKEYGVSEKQADKLAGRIEEARNLMMEVTAGTPKIRPEWPFVLHHDNQLIDGTIDLLCHSKTGFKIFDYKFTESSNEQILENYRAQMELYAQAVNRLHPDTEEQAMYLVVISQNNTRLLPIEISTACT